MKITVKFPEPVTTPALLQSDTLEFTTDCAGVDSKGAYIKWGDFSANFWFCAAAGKTPAISCANAIRRIRGGLLKLPEGTVISYEANQDDRVQLCIPSLLQRNPR